MIEIRNQPAQAPGIHPQDLGGPAAENTDLASAHTDGTNGADPLAKFGAMNGFHPGVTLYAGPAGGASKGAQQSGTPTTYDVAAMSPATIDAMKNSSDPATRKLGITIDNVKSAYGDLKGAKILVIASHGNGGEPVVVMTGPKFNPADKARVITFYHGDNATVGDPVGSKAGINTRIRDAFDKQPQTVFVLPEAVREDGKPWREGTDAPQSRDANDYHASWTNVRNQAETTDEALKAAGIPKDKVGTEIVAVHSRGGSVISRLMNLDPSGKSLRANRLELYDSLYGSQNAVAEWGKTANGKAVGSVIFYHGTNDAGAESPIARRFGDKFVKIDMGGNLIGVPKNEAWKDANGNTVPRDYYWTDKAGTKHVRHDVVRDFHESAHYKTTGIFFGRDPGLNAI